MKILTHNDSNDFVINSVTHEDDFVKISGSAAHFNVPNLNMQRVDSKSFEKSIENFKNKIVIPALNYNHNPNCLIGGITDLYTTDNTLEVGARLNKNIPLVSEMILPMMEAGDLRSFSTEGYIDLNNCRQFDDGTYYTHEFQLTAVAIVAVPADHQSKFEIQNYFHNKFVTNRIVKYYFF